jgi:outer membrane protein TolC
VLRWKTQLYAAEKNIAGQIASVRINRIALNQVQDKPEEQFDVLEKLTIEKDGFIFSSSFVDRVLENESSMLILRDYLVELGLGNSPVLGSMDAEISAQERQLKSDKRWLIPKFSLMAGADELFLISDDADGNRQKNGLDFWFVGATVNWNVFSGGSNFSKIKQQKIQAQELQFQRKEAMTSQEKAIRSNITQLIADYQKVSLAEEQAEVADQNYSMVYESYLLGEVSLLVLLDAQEQKFKADYSAVIAYYTFLIDLLSLEESIGYFPFLEPQEEVDLIIDELERRLVER